MTKFRSGPSFLSKLVVNTRGYETALQALDFLCLVGPDNGLYQ